MLSKEFYSHGKLLITGEYLVLDGARALAVPTKFGQDLIVNKIDVPFLEWDSFDTNKNIWFSCKFDMVHLEPNVKNKISLTLSGILKKARSLNKNFLSDSSGFQIKTNLSFNKNWGLGTSSTLINNIAKWAEVDAFELLRLSYGGSGYDIACAQNDRPILYQIVDSKPDVRFADFNPVFRKELFFIYLNKKQDSRDEIRNYKENILSNTNLIHAISQLSVELLNTIKLLDFERIMAEHERIIGSIIRKPPIQKQLFADYFGQIKSLGAWGGDFILATGNSDTIQYFQNKGFNTVLRFDDLVL